MNKQISTVAEAVKLLEEEKAWQERGGYGSQAANAAVVDLIEIADFFLSKLSSTQEKAHEDVGC